MFIRSITSDVAACSTCRVSSKTWYEHDEPCMLSKLCISAERCSNPCRNVPRPTTGSSKPEQPFRQFERNSLVDLNLLRCLFCHRSYTQKEQNSTPTPAAMLQCRQQEQAQFNSHLSTSSETTGATSPQNFAPTPVATFHGPLRDHANPNETSQLSFCALVPCTFINPQLGNR